MAQRPAEVSQGLAASPDQAGAFLQPGEFGGIQAAEADFSGILVDPAGGPKFQQRLQSWPDARHRKRQQAAIEQRQDEGFIVRSLHKFGSLRSRDQADQGRDEIHLLAIHRHPKMKFQPVDAGTFHQFRFDVRIGREHLHREIVVDLDRPAGASQPRDFLGDDLQPGRVRAVFAQGEIIGVSMLVIDRHHLMHRSEAHCRKFGQCLCLGGAVAFDLVKDAVTNGDPRERLETAREGKWTILIRQARQRHGIQPPPEQLGRPPAVAWIAWQGAADQAQMRAHRFLDQFRRLHLHRHG